VAPENKENRMPEVMSLKEHLVEELRDLLDAEQQLTRALPRLAAAAATPKLRAAFEKHLGETRQHVERLNQALSALGESPRPKRCDGMRGLLIEGNAHLSSAPKGALRDAMLIASSQKVEHYEMSAYGTARTYAEVLGRGDVARLLDDTLQEEKTADLTLTEIAESTVNHRAAEEWHQRSAGLVAQSAEWLGHTVATATQQVRRVASAVGARRGDAEQMADSVSQAVDHAREVVGGAAETAATRAKRLARQTAKQARAYAADLTPAKKRGKTRTAPGKRRKAAARRTRTRSR
jgi:ferritin-like metal-binding protein YciE